MASGLSSSARRYANERRQSRQNGHETGNYQAPDVPTLPPTSCRLRLYEHDQVGSAADFADSGADSVSGKVGTAGPGAERAHLALPTSPTLFRMTYAGVSGGLGLPTCNCQRTPPFRSFAVPSRAT